MANRNLWSYLKASGAGGGKGSASPDLRQLGPLGQGSCRAPQPPPLKQKTGTQTAAAEFAVAAAAGNKFGRAGRRAENLAIFSDLAFFA